MKGMIKVNEEEKINEDVGHSSAEVEFFDACEFGGMEQQPIRIGNEFGIEFMEQTEEMISEYIDIFGSKVPYFIENKQRPTGVFAGGHIQRDVGK